MNLSFFFFFFLFFLVKVSFFLQWQLLSYNTDFLQGVDGLAQVTIPGTPNNIISIVGWKFQKHGISWQHIHLVGCILYLYNMLDWFLNPLIEIKTNIEHCQTHSIERSRKHATYMLCQYSS